MAKIYAPNKEYTGISAGVPFVNGVGETDKPYLIEWFKTHGYEVEAPKKKSAKKPPNDPGTQQPPNETRPPDDPGGGEE